MKISLLFLLMGHAYLCAMHDETVKEQSHAEYREIGDSLFSWSQTNDFGKPYTHVLGQKDVNNAVSSSGTMKLISQAGRYYLTQDMHISPAQTGVTCLKITTSNVILDLRGYSIMGNTDTGSGMIGIEIASDLTNISLVNGSVVALNGIGIKVNSGCNNIIINNILVSNCTHTGILLDTVTDAHIHNLTINKCDGSNAGASGAIGLKLSTCSRIYVWDSHFGGNQAASSGNAIGVHCYQSSGCNFENCTAMQNKAGSSTGDIVYGFYIEDATGSDIILKNCIASKNQSQDGKAYGFYITNTNALYMQDCLALGNSAAGSTSTNTCIGFGISGSGACFLNNCKAIGNTGSQSVYGFWLSGTDFNTLSKCQSRNQTTSASGAVGVYGYYSTGGKGNKFDGCIAFGNVSGVHASSVAAGICLAGGEQYANILSCDIRANSGSGGTGYGIWLDDATYCAVKNNNLFVNVGDTNGYGIKDDATSSVSCYFENFAYANGKSNGLIVNNYDVTLSPNDNYSNFPVQVAYLTDFSTLKQTNYYDNVELLERVITAGL